MKKLWNMKLTVLPIIIIVLGSHQRYDKGTGGLGNKKTNREHPNYSFKIYLNTEKSPGDLRRLAVTQIPGDDH